MSQTDSYYCALMDVLNMLEKQHNRDQQTLERSRMRILALYADGHRFHARVAEDHRFYARVMDAQKCTLLTIDAILKLFDEGPQR